MATAKCLLHPHHISLVDTHSFKAKLQHVGDPYYNIDESRPHRGLLAPRFDILESADSYYIVGSIPSVVAKSELTMDWLDGQVLFIRGHIKETDPATEWGLPTTEGKDAAGLKKLHMERGTGEFERSFTLPGKVIEESLQSKLEAGILNLSVKKA